MCVNDGSHYGCPNETYALESAPSRGADEAFARRLGIPRSRWNAPGAERVSLSCDEDAGERVKAFGTQSLTSNKNPKIASLTAAVSAFGA